MTDMNWYWYTQYIHLYDGGWIAQAETTDEQGRLHKKSLSSGLHEKESDAEQDGIASGYPKGVKGSALNASTTDQ
jgi:hypothetical protein